MREVVLDTETTGLEAENGDRIVEIGCVEIENLIPTGRTYHQYINPERPMSDGAREITGLSDAFLADKPVFASVAQSFSDFVDGAILVIHNASFDMRFINAEYARLRRTPPPPDRVVDTLALARRRFPGAQASLDALCRRFQIDLSGRDKHGALLDAELLAQVYLELRGGVQPGLGLDAAEEAESAGAAASAARAKWSRARRSRITAEEAEAHERFIAEMGDGAIWRAVRSTGEA